MANETEKQENGTAVGGLIDPVVMRFRCGWCGAPTDELGYVLPDIPKEYLPFWNGAISVDGKCCETDIRNHEEHVQEMLDSLYRDV